MNLSVFNVGKINILIVFIALSNHLEGDCCKILCHNILLIFSRAVLALNLGKLIVNGLKLNPGLFIIIEHKEIKPQVNVNQDFFKVLSPVISIPVAC